VGERRESEREPGRADRVSLLVSTRQRGGYRESTRIEGRSRTAMDLCSPPLRYTTLDARNWCTRAPRTTQAKRILVRPSARPSARISENSSARPPPACRDNRNGSKHTLPGLSGRVSARRAGRLLDVVGTATYGNRNRQKNPSHVSTERERLIDDATKIKRSTRTTATTAPG